MENALTAIDKAMELEPNNKNIIWNRACTLAECAIMNGGNPRSMLEEALEIFQTVDNSNPVNRYYNIGNSLAGLGRHSEAIESYNLALDENS